MKRLIINIMMTALMLGTTQCKRDGKEITPNNNSVNITLDVGGVKNDVNPETGVVSFEDGDEILVANDGVYVGKLKINMELIGGLVLIGLGIKIWAEGFLMN